MVRLPRSRSALRCRGKADPTWILAVLVVSSVALAFAQDNRSRPFGPGHCGPADPSYVRVANATGGQVLPLGPNEIAAAAPLMSASSGTETLLWMTGSLTANGRTIRIPVDGVTSRVSFIASTDNSLADLTVLDPHGSPVGAGMTGVDASVFGCVRAVTVDRPASGEWSARVSGTGRFWLTAHARSELALDDAAFVHVAGRPGHEGLFKIAGQPMVNRPAMLRVLITRKDVTSETFDLVSMDGSTLQTLELSPVSPGPSEEEFVGSIARLPATPFRVRVSGRDRTGAAYQRVSRASFQAATLEVTAPETVSLTQGGRTAVKVRVTNEGAPTRVKVVAVANATVLRVEPADLQLGTNESREVTISIDIPTASPSSPDIIVTAESPGRAAASNSAILKTTVETAP